jgi:hypothetical protein
MDPNLLNPTYFNFNFTLKKSLQDEVKPSLFLCLIKYHTMKKGE